MSSAGTRAAERQYPKTVAARSATEFLEDGGSPGDLFLGKELRADLQGGFRSADADDIGEQTEVVDVPGPGDVFRDVPGFLKDIAAPHKPIAEGGERPFDLRPVEEDTPRFGHAASRPAAER